MAGGLALKSVLLALPMRLYLRSHVLTGYRALLAPTYRLLYVLLILIILSGQYVFFVFGMR